MALGKLLGKALPDLPEGAQPSITEQVLAVPQLTAARLLWESFRELQPWWPVLVPLLLWVGIRTYRSERAALATTKTI